MSQKTNWFTKSRRAQNENDYETWNEGGVANTLNAFDNGDVRATTIVFYGNRVDDIRVQGEVGNMPIMNEGQTVRRLTPTETERLQGFPDGWTKFDNEDKPQADSHRYKQMGNAVAVPVVDFLIRRLVQIDENAKNV